MARINEDAALTTCEALLLEEVRHCEAASIRPKFCAAVRRLLARAPEVKEAYLELYGDLYQYPHALRQLLVVVCEAVYTDESYVTAVRSQKRRLEDVNREISDLSLHLAGLLDERTELNNTSGFSSQTIYSPCDLVDRANEHNFLYRTYARANFLSATAPFDLKYWPTLGDCLRLLGQDALEAEIVPLDAVTDAATHGLRSSRTNVVLGLLAAIADCYGTGPGRLPAGYCPSDSALAGLLNVVLDVPSEELMTSDYIKGVRQRARRDGKLQDVV